MCRSALSTVNSFINHFCNCFAPRRGAGLKIRMLYGFHGFLESCKQIRFFENLISAASGDGTIQRGPTANP